jgi:hypothetical protein
VASIDPYRRNPARDLEKLAVSVVTAWVGETGVVTDTSSGGGPDFEIAYFDDRTAVGEVGWHEDPEIQAMWANTFRQEFHQTVELAPGRGTWSLQLVRGANIKALHQELPALIDAMIEGSCFSLKVTGNWPRGPVADCARRLGISYLTRHDESDSSRAIYFMPGDGGTVPAEPNVVAEWIESVLCDPAYADTTAKLLAVDPDERHVFLMSGSATPFGAGERLRQISEGLPTRGLNVPSGITHVWALSRFGPASVALWTHHGWSAVPVPQDL